MEPRFELGGERGRGDHVGHEREADPCRREPIEACASQAFSGSRQQPAVVIEQSVAADEPELDEFVQTPVRRGPADREPGHHVLGANGALAPDPLGDRHVALGQHSTPWRRSSSGWKTRTTTARPTARFDDRELADVEALDRVRMDHVLPASRPGAQSGQQTGGRSMRLLGGDPCPTRAGDRGNQLRRGRHVLSAA